MKNGLTKGIQVSTRYIMVTIVQLCVGQQQVDGSKDEGVGEEGKEVGE